MATRWPDCSWRPYAASALFNTPVPKGAAVDPRNATLLSYTTFDIPQNRESGPIGANDYGHPIYFALDSDPLYSVAVTRWGKELTGSKLRLPSGAKPAGGDDGHLGVVGPDGVEYSFWRAKIDSSAKTITAEGGGRGRIDTGDGVDDVGSATAACFGLSAGIIRACELAAGRIDHALFVIPTYCDDPPWPPAKGGANRAASSLWPVGSRPHCGQRLWLDMPWSEIDALALRSWEKAILRAFSLYGGIVGDTGHYSTVGVDLMVESQQSYVALTGQNPLLDFARSQGFSSLNIGAACQSVRHRFKWLAKPS